MKTKARPTSIYVIGRPNGPVKIGVATRPESRLRELQVGCPFKIEVLHSVEVPSREAAFRHEAMVHQVHLESWLRGEWFDLHPDIALEAIECSISTEAVFTSGVIA